MASGSPTGANIIEAQAAAKVNCIMPVYAPATRDPVRVAAVGVVAAGSSAADTASTNIRGGWLWRNLDLLALKEGGILERGEENASSLAAAAVSW